MNVSLQGKHALVLASSMGLGRAAAEALAAAGADLVITSSNQGRCEQVARSISRSSGRRAVPIAADLFIPESLGCLFAKAIDALGRIDILIINHPGPGLGLARDVDLDVLDSHYRMMVSNPIRLIRCALEGMRSRGWGRIVSVGGRSMIEPLPNKVMDNILRPAMVGYSKALANEVAADGITVNMILPGTFVTDRVHASTASNAALWGISVEEAMRRRIESIPARRFGELREFGAVVTFLCSEAASYVNGSVIRVDGSQTSSVY